MEKKLFILGIFMVLILGGCAGMTKAPDMATLDVRFEWSPADKCSPKSPAFMIKGIPPGTKTLKFMMTDLNVPSYYHGGGSVEYQGSGEIPAGAFSYKGPCPPSGSHDYRFVVTAVNAAGDTILGEGQATRAFPPK